MTEVLDRLKKALADRYAIERELGADGMATVYLAEPVEHRRSMSSQSLARLRLNRRSERR